MKLTFILTLHTSLPPAKQKIGILGDIPMVKVGRKNEKTVGLLVVEKSSRVYFWRKLLLWKLESGNPGGGHPNQKRRNKGAEVFGGHHEGVTECAEV